MGRSLCPIFITFYGCGCPPPPPAGFSSVSFSFFRAGLSTSTLISPKDLRTDSFHVTTICGRFNDVINPPKRKVSEL